MKKFIIFFTVIVLLIITVFLLLPKQENKDIILEQVKKETEIYKKMCFDESFPKGLDNYSMYGDALKNGDYRYHQCLKRNIIEKIDKLANKTDTEKMVKSLDKIQEGISDFYWDLYNREDNGSIGRGVNDASLGRYFEKILEDIIHYQYVFIHDTL